MNCQRTLPQFTQLDSHTHRVKDRVKDREKDREKDKEKDREKGMEKGTQHTHREKDGEHAAVPAYSHP